MANRFMTTKKTRAPFLEIREALVRLRLRSSHKIVRCRWIKLLKFSIIDADARRGSQCLRTRLPCRTTEYFEAPKLGDA
jgi:hypothetical protein